MKVMKQQANLTKYKIIAFIGLIIMGIGSFMSCLAPTAAMCNVGSGILIASIIIMAYAFYFWRP